MMDESTFLHNLGERLFTFENTLIAEKSIAFALVAFLVSMSFTVSQAVALIAVVIGVVVIAGVLVSLDIHPMNSYDRKNK